MPPRRHLLTAPPLPSYTPSLPLPLFNYGFPLDRPPPDAKTYQRLRMSLTELGPVDKWDNVKGRDVPPNPELIFAPTMPITTRAGTNYARWERARIRDYLTREPDPRVPDSSAKKAELESLLNTFKQRLRQIASLPDRLLNNTSSDKRVQTSISFAESVWKSKVLSCRLMGLSRFPPEIIVLIHDYILSDNTMRYRLTLSWVCRRWRRLLIENRPLWTNIWIREKAPFPLTRMTIERAGALPISLRIGDEASALLSDDGPCMSGEEMESLMSMLYPKLGQVNVLIVVVRSWPAALALFEKLYNAPISPRLLERLEIHRTGSGYLDANTSNVWARYARTLRLCRGNIPSLNFLVLDGVHIDWAIPLNNLHTLDLRRFPTAVGPAFDRFQEILLLSPGLHALYLDSTGPRTSAGQFRSRVRRVPLPSLRILCMGSMDLEYMLSILYYLDAPNVIELILKSRHPTLDHSITFRSLTGRFPRVRILQLTGMFVMPTPENSGVMARWLMSIPHLQLLRVSLVTDVLLKFFQEDARYYLNGNAPAVMGAAAQRAIEANHPQPIRLAPRLRAIQFDSVPVQHICDFLSIRRALGLTLEKAYVTRKWFSGQEESLRELLVKGIHTCLTEGLVAGSTDEERAIWDDVEAEDHIAAMA